MFLVCFLISTAANLLAVPQNYKCSLDCCDRTQGKHRSEFTAAAFIFPLSINHVSWHHLGFRLVFHVPESFRDALPVPVQWLISNRYITCLAFVTNIESRRAPNLSAVNPQISMRTWCHCGTAITAKWHCICCQVALLHGCCGSATWPQLLSHLPQLREPLRHCELWPSGTPNCGQNCSVMLSQPVERRFSHIELQEISPSEKSRSDQAAT